MIFQGAKFCSHCGARADRAELDSANESQCPRCRTRLQSVLVGDTPFHECPRCQGLWADNTSVQQICADRERQAAVLGMAVHSPGATEQAVEPKIRYLPCPVCHKLMHRVNFARFSGVIVDTCKGHGTWFDRDELRRIVEFVRAGGMDAVRAKEIAELQEERRKANAAKVASAWDNRIQGNDVTFGDLEIGLSALDSLLKLLRQ